MLKIQHYYAQTMPIRYFWKGQTCTISPISNQAYRCLFGALTEDYMDHRLHHNWEMGHVKPNHVSCACTNSVGP